MKMQDEERMRKLGKVAITLCVAAGAVSLVVFIPQVRELIIGLGERYVGRPLTHEVWHARFVRWEKAFLLADVALLVFVFIVLKLNITTTKIRGVLEAGLRTVVGIPDFKKWVGISAVLYFIGISALLRANFLYDDDLQRTFSGYQGWESYSRHLSNFFSTVLHCDTYLTDVSPLTQMAAIVFLAVASVVTISVLSEDKKITFGRIVAAIPIGLSPYFLECLSFKYDSPYMALSVLVSILPFLFAPSHNETKQVTKQNLKSRICDHIPYAVISIICVLSMCMLYQASSGIYPMLVLILLLKRWNKKEPFIIFLLTSIAAFFVALIVFKLFFMPEVDTYVCTKINIRQLVPQGIKNLLHYYSLVKGDYKKQWLVLHIVNIALFVAVCTIRSSQRKAIALAFNMFGALLLLCLAFGVYPALERPLFDTRAMYGFGVLCGFISTTIVCQTKSILPKLPSFVLSWMFFVFAFTYGNALAEQKRYTDFRVQLVISDLNEVEDFANTNIKNVQLSGGIGKSPILRNQPQNFQILDRLVPYTFEGSGYWSRYHFYNYFSLRNIHESDNTADLNATDLPVIKDTMYHTIKGDGTNFLVILK